MGRRMIRHLVSAGVGVAAAPCVAFLFLDGIGRTAFLSIAMQTFQLPGLTPSTGLGVPMHSAWLPAVELAAAAAVAGTLAGTRMLSPVAPLVAALPLLAIHFYAHSGLAELADFVRLTPPRFSLPVQQAILADAFLLIGGVLAVSAIEPWRWRSGQPPAPWANWHAVGVIAGMAAIPALWLVLQLSEGAASSVGPPGVLTFESEFLLFMIGGAIVMGLLSSARWLSPVAAVVAGVPLLAVGLFTLLAPATAQSVIVHLVYGRYWQPASETLAASGWLVLFGGMLLTAGIMPGRWRRLPASAPAAAEQTPGTLPGQELNPELAP